MSARRIGVIDTTFRSLMRLQPTGLARIGHLSPILETMDRVGFRAIDVWGDMTFDHALQMLQESPWERMRGIALHVWDSDRRSCIARSIRCLEEFTLEGLPTTRDLQLDILRSPSFVEGRYSTGFLDKSMNDLPALVQQVSRG